MTKSKQSRRQRRRQRYAERRRSRQRRWALIVGVMVLVAGGLLAFRIVRDADSQIGAGDVSPANSEGPLSAPVQIVEFGDFGCPSCRAWHNSGIKARLQAEFGDQIRFTFRHLPVITPQSPKAAEATQCAADQGAFWEYHDYLYEQVSPSQLSPSALKAYAANLGLDAQAFSDCLDAGRYQAYVQRDMQAALDLGARGTPSFFVNGQPADLFTYPTAVSAIRRHLP